MSGKAGRRVVNGWRSVNREKSSCSEGGRRRVWRAGLSCRRRLLCALTANPWPPTISGFIGFSICVSDYRQTFFLILYFGLHFF